VVVSNRPMNEELRCWVNAVGACHAPAFALTCESVKQMPGTLAEKKAGYTLNLSMENELAMLHDSKNTEHAWMAIDRDGQPESTKA
jgi:uncharacterized protein YdbL (DUF1318 family)